MQCDETISHMVTAGRSYFRTLRNACVTTGKTTMTAGKIYHGCFEMISWPYRTSANIINTCFWFLETCTKCSYFIEEMIRPGAQRLAFEVKYEHIVRQPRIYRGPAFCAWASFQTSGNWSEKTGVEVKETENFDLCRFWVTYKELNQTVPRFMAVQELDRDQCTHRGPQKFFQGGQRQNFSYPLQVADDAIQIDVPKTLYPFYPIRLCWLNFKAQFFV